MEQPIIDPNETNPTPFIASDPNLVGIRGWLLFLAIGLYCGCLIGWLTPAMYFSGFYGIVYSMQDFPFLKGVTNGYGRIRVTFGDFFWGIYFLLHSLAGMVFYIWLCSIAIRFARKRTTAPPMLIRYLKANISVAGVFLVIGVIGGILWEKVPSAPDIGKVISLQFSGFLGACGGVFIWGNYLKRSKRVRATFVN